MFQTELQSFAKRAEQVRAVVDPGFRSIFRVCNLQSSLNLLEELKLASCTHTSTKATQTRAGETPHRVTIAYHVEPLTCSLALVFQFQDECEHD